ncbi:competence protein CoiA [Niallia sp. Krafla_26]|uniref:competence protein CoiA n=1 Tax=Niallia sp. Krafla_26 TaxID=3064703 RepID=UPI003D182A4D
MLTALREDGTLFQLLPRLSKDVLRKEKAGGHYYCPECKERVTMKIGMQRMEHFAHQAGSQCIESYERESSFHLNGKMQLYQWLKEQKLYPRLEPYYERLKQRPDISVDYSQQEYAIEYQCSPIPPQLMIKRTNTYRKNNIDCVWILGGNQLKRKSEKKVSLTQFDYLLLNKTPDGKWYLPYYCSNSHKFVFLTNIIPTSAKNALTQFSIFPIQNRSIQQILTHKMNEFLYAKEWRNEMRAQKLRMGMNSHSQIDYLKELYIHHLNISLLPIMIGLPINHAPFIETSPLIWQSYLFIDLFRNKKKDEIITFSEVYRCFMHRVQRGQINLRTLPLIENYSITVPLIEYLKLLVGIHVLEAINYNTFRLKADILIPDHVVSQQKQEEHFYKEFHQVIFRV